MRIIYMTLLFIATTLAQEANQNTNSFFDDSEGRTFALKSLVVEGEVENPGSVDLGPLPLRQMPVKEVSLENGKHVFKGAYYYGGYSLYDILNGRKVKKVAENDFSPFVDLYVIVENDKGEKAVFSWGEIYYSRDNFKVLISKSVQAINPSKLSSVKWHLPEEPRLVCGNDLLNVRFLNNPIKITVQSYRGKFATEKPKEIFSPEIKILAKSGPSTIREVGTSVERRQYGGIGYGHGTGFKGILDVKGFLLRDVLNANLKVTVEDLKQAIAVVSAKDGYRCAYSISEMMNRNDNQEFVLIDRKESREDGRYTLFAAADFFVDRNVKAIEKIEIVRIQ